MIHLHHAAPPWIAWRTKSRLDGHSVGVVASVAQSKSLKYIRYFDSPFVEKWLEKDGKVPKKDRTCGYSLFCEGYIFDTEGKFQS